MTPFRARLTLSAVLAIFLITATNALFLQDRSRTRQGLGASSAVSVTQFPAGQAASTPVTASRQADAAQNQQRPTEPAKPADKASRLQAALQRELLRKGYASQTHLQNFNLSAALLVYEYDSGLPLTGKPTEALLKHLIFDLDPAPRGPFADRAEADPKLVLATQKALLELGFFSGTLSGHVDVWTANAIKAFEHHRGLPVTGRLNEITLLELVSFSGQPLRVAG